MFDTREEHYRDVATEWEINHERFAGEEIHDEPDYGDLHDAEEESTGTSPIMTSSDGGFASCWNAPDES